MVGRWTNNSADDSSMAAATRPRRCTSRPRLSGNTPKIPNVDGPKRIAHHAVVVGSFWTNRRLDRRKFATFSFLPGFASKRIHKPAVSISLLSLIPNHPKKSLQVYGQRKLPLGYDESTERT